eukprot:2879810-Amphidinium_carterae.2
MFPVQHGRKEWSGPHNGSLLTSTEESGMSGVPSLRIVFRGLQLGSSSGSRRFARLLPINKRRGACTARPWPTHLPKVLRKRASRRRSPLQNLQCCFNTLWDVQ